MSFIMRAIAGTKEFANGVQSRAHGHSSITEVLNFIFNFVAFNFFSRLLMYSLLSSESACC